MAASLSPEVLQLVEDARVLARRLGHDALSEEHLLLAFAASNPGALLLSANHVDVAKLQTAVEAHAGHREAGGYRGSFLREDAVTPLLERAHAARRLWHRWRPLQLLDVFALLATTRPLADVVNQSRFDVSPVLAFAERARAAALARRHRNVLAEHALLGTCNEPVFRAPLERAGMDVKALRKTLGKLLRRRRFASAKLASPAALVTLACLRANQRRAPAPSVEPLLVELLRHSLVHKSLASAGVDAFVLLFALVHGESLADDEERDAARSGPTSVVLFDDAYTTMQAVVSILSAAFDREREAAVATMLEVHEQGSASIGSFDANDARERVATARRLARAAGMPLRLSLAPAP